MSPRRSSVLCLAAAALLPTAALACLWDYDTLRMERSRSPSALEVITGKFLRHTPEFYRWRIDDRLRKLKSDPDNLGYYDDLAVAYEKTGQHDLALATIRDKAAKKPGVYETESNLGTFLMLDGQLEEGLKHIDAALAINPDAHFGREKYQKYLAEYMIHRRVDGKVPLPLGPGRRSHESGVYYSFADFLANSPGPQSGPLLKERDRQAALKGVLGMMRFANHDSPVLLEVLGNLLATRQGIGADEKQLAARAYLKASYAVADEPARQAYRDNAREALRNQSRFRDATVQMSLEDLEASFQGELRQAEAWFADVRRNELAWIAAGKNPEAEFANQYFGTPPVAADDREELPLSPRAWFFFFLFFVAVPAAIFREWRKRRDHQRPGPANVSTPELPESVDASGV